MTATAAPVLAAPKGRLLRVLGLAFGVAVLIGNSIGMGILRTPGEVAAHVPSVPLFLLVWIIGAAYALLGALCVSELSAMRPRSGGLYPLVHDALGPFAGFLSGWTDWIGTCCSMAAVAIVLGEYAGPLMPVLQGHSVAVASTVVVAFALLQWRGIRVGNVAQLVTSLVKGVALLALAVIALVTALPESIVAPHGASTPGMPQGLALAAALVVALQSAIYTYDGWTGPIYFGEEIRDPARELPRSMIGGVVLVLAIYLALNLAFLRVLGIEAMAGDPFVAATAAARLFGAGGDTALRILMIVSLVAAVNALQLMASRIPHAMSGDGLLPAMMGRVNPGGTPVPSAFASTVLTLIFVISGTFDAVLALLAFFFVANYVLAFIALFVQRRRHPEVPRPFRVPGYPFVPLLALGSSVFFLAMAVWGDRSHSLMAIGLLALAWPIYYAQSRWQQRDVTSR